MFTAARAMTQLKTRLEADVAGLTVQTAPIDVGLLDEATLMFIGVEAREQDWTAIGAARRTDDYIIHGMIQATKKGAGDAVATGARDAADQLFRDVGNALTALLTDKAALEAFKTAIGAHALRTLNPRQVTFTQGAGDAGRWARFRIAIDVVAHVIP